MSQTTPKNPAIYVRVSKNNQKSRDAQLHECKEWMQRNGWPVGPIYSEAVSTLKGDKRPEYARCRQDIKSGHVDGLIVWRMDRWGRNLPELVRDLDMFRHLGVPFRSTSENIKADTATDRMQAYVIAVFAQYDREKRAEAISMGTREAIRKGNTRGGRPRVVEAAYIVRFMQAGHTWKQCREKYDISDATIGRAMRAHKAKADSLEQLETRGRPPLDLSTPELPEELERAPRSDR